MAGPLGKGTFLEALKKFRKRMTTKLERGGSLSGPLVVELFCGFPHLL